LGNTAALELVTQRLGDEAALGSLLAAEAPSSEGYSTYSIAREGRDWYIKCGRLRMRGEIAFRHLHGGKRIWGRKRTPRIELASERGDEAAPGCERPFTHFCRSSGVTTPSTNLRFESVTRANELLVVVKKASRSSSGVSGVMTEVA
jgi:hypothetical protein